MGILWSSDMIKGSPTIQAFGSYLQNPTNLIFKFGQNKKLRTVLTTEEAKWISRIPISHGAAGDSLIWHLNKGKKRRVKVHYPQEFYCSS